jgi:hypothetical protein
MQEKMSSTKQNTSLRPKTNKKAYYRKREKIIILKTDTKSMKNTKIRKGRLIEYLLPNK